MTAIAPLVPLSIPTNTPAEDDDCVDEFSRVLGELGVASVSLVKCDWVIVDTVLSEVVLKTETYHFIVWAPLPHARLGAGVVELGGRVWESVHATCHAPDGGGKIHVFLLTG